MEYIAFFCAVRHSDDNESFMVDTLKLYTIGRYLIVRETSIETTHSETDGQHYHFLVQMTNEDWIRYRKRVLIDHFKLRGRASPGKPRQYGKVAYLKSPERMAIYMCKDILEETNGLGDVLEESNVVATTMSKTQLELWHSQSSAKAGRLVLREKVIKFLSECYIGCRYHEKSNEACPVAVKWWLQERILEYHVEEKTEASVSRSALESLSVWFLVHRTGFTPFQKLNGIRDISWSSNS